MMMNLNGMIKSMRKTIMITSRIWILRKTLRGKIVDRIIMIVAQQAAKDRLATIKLAEKTIALDNKLIA